MSTSEKDYGDAQLAAVIVKLRKGLELSMEAFAEQLGVSQPTQSRIERAKRVPDALYLRALRNRFHIDINALLDSEDSATATPGGASLPDTYQASAPENKAHSIKTSGRASAAASEPAKSRKRAA